MIINVHRRIKKKGDTVNQIILLSCKNNNAPYFQIFSLGNLLCDYIFSNKKTGVKWFNYQNVSLKI